MRIIYSFLLAIAFFVLLPVFFYQAIVRRKYLENLRERLGMLPREMAAGRASEDGATIWIHAVSVGESLSAVPLMTGLRKRFPRARIILSTTTQAGQAPARRQADGPDGSCYFPFDWKFAVRRSLNAIRPGIVILMESELWLNFLDECDRRKIPVLVANGRISDRSFRRSGRFGFFIRPLYGLVSRFAMQSRGDAERAIALGAPADRVEVTGNLKYDLGEARGAGAGGGFADGWGLAGPLIVAGSTHEGEERALLAAFGRVRERPGLAGTRLLIAPRHPERFGAVARDIAEAGWPLARRSEPSEADRQAPVILLDSIGELAAVYPLATVVFIGGSLVPVGGHNILEPAACGKPILVGWHMHNFRDITEEFLRREAVLQLRESSGEALIEQLAAELGSCLTEEARAARLGANASRAVEENRGATARTIDLVASLLG